MTLNAGQKSALNDMMDAKGQHLLMGNAGTGKTHLMNQYTIKLAQKKRRPVVTAPTHKATSVLASKITHPEVACTTIHSLLGLTPREGDNGTFLHRRPNARPIEQTHVVIDEASMLSEELMMWIDKLLYRQTVIFSGDDAQLPPIGEERSRSFDIQSKSTLTEVVRQAAGNPVLEAALICRDHQRTKKDGFDYLRARNSLSQGIYDVDPSKKGSWIRKAFTSDTFKSDPNAFRYLAWTNAVVDNVNKRIQYLIYGDIDTPLAPGEVALNRKRYVYGGVEANTSEEFIIESINPSMAHVSWDQYGGDQSFDIAVWSIVTRCGKTIRMVRDKSAYSQALQYIQRTFKKLDEPVDGWGVYQHLSDFRDSFGHLTSNFAMTVHNSQGSTFGSVFMNVPDIMKRRKSNLMETHQLFYVGMTRPQEMVFCV